jgi:hypothetical protein
MAYSAPPNSVFQIEDDDLEVPAAEDDPTLSDSKQSQSEHIKLLYTADNAVDLAAGTAGCCGAVCLSCSCLCLGQCHDELVDTYNRFTLCGRWWPVG